VSSGRPLITANMVTFARLVPMPLVAWFAFRGDIWIALVLGTLIGCTDFIDGYLARKHGPTVLGGLMDPIADKVFIAFAYLPFVGNGFFPAWAVAAMFVRELLVTALRTAYERRDLRMKTSYLGKIKTWTQMQGIGMTMLFVLLEKSGDRDVLLGLLIAGMVAPLIAFGVLWAVKKRRWKGALVMSALQAPLLWLHFHGDVRLTVEVIMYAVLAATWISGVDYLVVGLRQLRDTARLDGGDWVRLLGAVALPALLVAVLVYTPASPWPVMVVLALELAAGGLDNLLAHHKKQSGALPWGLRLAGTCAALGAAVLLADQSAAGVNAAVAAALAVCTIGVAWEFWRGRDVYLDPTRRDKRAAQTVTAP
jgi:CDP-diacylglycerol--glycerol-3-phosphate 3-phosphatidyltransferase